MPKINPTAYFLPYQIAWLQDASRLKISEKSRRVGMTYAQSYEDVRDAARAVGAVDVWFSSADITAAREYIRYCTQWARLFQIAAKDLGEIAIADEQDVRVYAIEFSSGQRINALSSNPGQFRSKGGKVVLDEFAKHEHADDLWTAARPSITWGYPMRVISTHNGRKCRYFKMVEDARSPESPWSLHRTTIFDAVDQGLADKIARRSLTPAERTAWIENERLICGDEDTWKQEYCCEPVDSATAWLTWELIYAAQNNHAGDPNGYARGWAYVGMDVARRGDKTIIWVLEPMGDVLWTREVVSMRKATFAEQLDRLATVMNQYRVNRLCIDQTGLGEFMVDEAKRRFGQNKVEGVQFTRSVKQDLATVIKQRFEDHQVRIPADRSICDAHHAVRRMMTVAGNPRFDAERTDEGHADEFWAHCLAIHAAGEPSPPIEFQASGDRWSDSQVGLAGLGGRSGGMGMAGDSLFDWS